MLDLGAGYGAITTALAASGARVIAVERDPRSAAVLRRRVSRSPLVSVVEADLREIPLPHRDFLVVANIPFAISTLLLRRLAGDSSVPLAGAELITSWGLARRVTAAVPRNAEAAWWAARYQIQLVRGVAPASFTPPPRTDAAHLSIRPRPLTRSVPGQRLLGRLTARRLPAARHPGAATAVRPARPRPATARPRRAAPGPPPGRRAQPGQRRSHHRRPVAPAHHAPHQPLLTGPAPLRGGKCANTTYFPPHKGWGNRGAARRRDRGAG